MPWWSLAGISTFPSAERKTTMYLHPAVMIESTTYDSATSLDIAEMPDIYLDVLDTIVVASYAASVFLGLALVFLFFKKNNYALLVGIVGVLILISIVSLYFIGTVKLCEASIGDVQGTGTIQIELDNSIPMQAHWGFDIGFYLSLAAALFASGGFMLSVRDVLLGKRNSK